MKITLEFDIPDEQESLNEHMHGPKYHAVLWELLNTKLRPIYKHGILPEGYKSEEVLEFAEEIRSFIYSSLNEEGVSEDF